MKYKYIPIIRTGNAETKGVNFLDDSIKDTITPIFELTRSRKTKLSEGAISKKLDKIEEIFGATRPFILDLTSDERLLSAEIRSLQDSVDGYKNWRNFLLQQKNRFPKIIPMLQVVEDETISIEENRDNLKKQIEFIASNFNIFFYQNKITDDYYGEDLSVICSMLGKSKIKKLYCCIDSVFINQNRASDISKKVIERIRDINQKFNMVNFSTAGTSFPKSVSDYSTDDSVTMKLEEVGLWDKVADSIKEKTLNIIYGDYGSINQERNDIIATGWIPRIDVPTSDILFYYRKKRGSNTYQSTYADVARKVVDDSRYKSLSSSIDCWGLEQIEKTSRGEKTGLSPSFWISVRLNIHLTVQATLKNAI